MNDTVLKLPNGDMTTVGWLEEHGPLEVVVHSFGMGDVEDPDLCAAEPLWLWQNTEMGDWVMANAIQPPSWHRKINPASFGWTYTIVAELTPKDYTFWWIKWGHVLTQ